MTAGKAAYGKKEALALAAGARRLVAAKGTKVVEIDLKAGAQDSEILALMLGPTGNLRAPTIRAGDTLYVGFPKKGFDDLR